MGFNVDAQGYYENHELLVRYADLKLFQIFSSKHESVFTGTTIQITIDKQTGKFQKSCHSSIKT